MTTNEISGSGHVGRRSGRLAVELGHNAVSTGRVIPADLVSGLGSTGMHSPLLAADLPPAAVDRADG
ncbi:hypothetical protein [Acidipropionibacterium virtanenii]|uniref:Uncharacterized protein n=1 Tax=Acidipropionibacterium virtanenii TaxID=2057246 RepID=A0A344UQ26_9ACTN|nr:hypothetical protein [Acidipropionibacterium virtanenii]AXE37374.1 hypothetical protein JS278_00177 [Acidipropionibacterium virtanenii]